MFNVSVLGVKERNKLRKETVGLSKRKLNRKPRKYTLEKMEGIFADKPGAYLSETAEHFDEGTTSGVHKALKSIKITFKKTTIYKERNEEKRKSVG